MAMDESELLSSPLRITTPDYHYHDYYISALRLRPHQKAANYNHNTALNAISVGLIIYQCTTMGGRTTDYDFMRRKENILCCVRC